VPDDLDAIVMMATRPEPERRYASAMALADDVRAWLDGRAVLARGDSMSYRARRFVARHRVATTFATTAVVALAALTAAVGWGYLNAERERGRAQAIGDFLKDTLRGAQPYIAQGRDSTLLEEILDGAAARIENELADDAYAAADVHATIAQTRRLLADYELAQSHAEAAAQGFLDQLGPDARETLYARQLLGLIHWDQGDYEAAERVARDVYRRARATLPPGDDVVASASVNLGLALRAQGRVADAEPYYREALNAAQARSGAGSPEAIGATGNLAFLLAELDRLDEAESLARQAVALARRHLGPDNPDTYLELDKLASLLGERGALAEALRLHEEAIAGLTRLLGARHSTTLGSRYATAVALRRLGRAEASVAILQDILPVIRADYGSDSRFLVPTLNELGRAELAAGRAGAAAAALEAARAAAQRLLGADHFQTALVSIHLGDALLTLGERKRAGALLDAARGQLEKTFGDDPGHRYFDDLARVEGRLAAAAAAHPSAAPR
jgi:tetratricopeptide (TPR) repeat protein